MSSFPIPNSVVLARLKPFGISMEKSLSDLIKGIRTHSKESPEGLLEFLNEAINECKDELNTTDLEVKATAILKLTYLEMYGFDMSWCNFHILEVMSSSKFQQKRIGYLAAIQSLKSETELLILATNQFKKDLNSHNHVEVGLALSGIATIVSSPLAKDILDDVVMKLSHSKPYIRKKAVLALFKVFLQYPESLRTTLSRVIEKLDDPDVAVVSATITIICEISKKNPNIFMPYLPKFFSILEETSNNWLIIRILKLFQSLLKIEPRMKKRIMPSILNLLGKTEATSLVYECINCIVNGGMISGASSRDKEVAKICVDHLMKFFDTRDSNLKFVGLLALIKILIIFPIFIHKVKGVSAIVMDCLTDEDMIIKRKALEICHYLATEDNMAHLVKTLLLQLVPDTSLAVIEDSLKLDFTRKILQIASADNYANIPNFKWYVTALKELVNLTLLSDSNKFSKSSAATLSEETLSAIAILIGREFNSVSIRVPSIRPYVITKVVMDYTNIVRPLEACPLLMRSIYWIMGEYVKDFGVLEDEDDSEVDIAVALGQKISIFNNLVNCYVDEHINKGSHFFVSHKVSQLEEPDVVTVLIDSIVKLFNGIISDYRALYVEEEKIQYRKFCEIGYFLTKLISFLEHWQLHSSFQVQERCLSWLEYLKLCVDALDLEDGVEAVKKEELEYFAHKFARRASIASANGEDSILEGDDSDESDDSDEASVNAENFQDQQDLENFNENEDLPADAALEMSKRKPMQIPSILSQVLPSFFQSYQLNPISVSAQSHVAVPEGLDLESQINDVPSYCFDESDHPSDDDSLSGEEENSSSENIPDEAAQRERSERLKEDPYYISGSSKKKVSKPKQRFLNLDDSNARDVSISPSDLESLSYLTNNAIPKTRKKSKLKKEKVVILLEETLGHELPNPPLPNAAQEKNNRTSKLIIDSYGLEKLNLNFLEDLGDPKKDYEHDVDLNVMRQDLEKRAKKAKTKSKKVKTATKNNSAAEEPTAEHEDQPNNPIKESTSDLIAKVEPVAVAAAKKPKKKKKAVIID